MTVTTRLTALRRCTGGKMSFTLEKYCEILNTRNKVEVIQMLHEKFFELESFLDDH